jgi:hypothetical protein
VLKLLKCLLRAGLFNFGSNYDDPLSHLEAALNAEPEFHEFPLYDDQPAESLLICRNRQHRKPVPDTRSVEQLTGQPEHVAKAAEPPNDICENEPFASGSRQRCIELCRLSSDQNRVKKLFYDNFDRRWRNGSTHTLPPWLPFRSLSSMSGMGDVRFEGDHPTLQEIEAHCAAISPDNELALRIESHIRECLECSLLLNTTVKRIWFDKTFGSQ